MSFRRASWARGRGCWSSLGVGAVGVVGVLALLPGCGSEGGGEVDPRPDVLLITLDTTRADALGCYGGGGDASPFLDGLAARSTLFEGAIAQAAVTPVSHATILTGLQPYTHGVRVLHGVQGNRLPEGAETLAEVLAAEGYATGAFLSAFPVTERFGFRQGFDHFDQDFLEAHRASVSEKGMVDTGRSQRRGDDTTDRALRWMGETQGPRFTWVHYFDPHDGLVVPPAEFMQAFGEPPADERERLRALYHHEVKYMDQQIGRLLEAVDLDRTIVAVVSDHGEGLGEHDWWTHGVLYQEQIHVPLIVHAPGRGEGRSVGGQVRTADLMPTLLDAAGVPGARQPPMDGQSLMPWIEGDEAPPRLLAYADSVNMLTYRFTPRLIDRKTDMLFAILDGGWKYVHHALREDESELYDLEQDPDELVNLLATRPDQLTRMRDLMRGIDFLPREQPGVQNMSEEDRERLRRLGYEQD